MNIISSITKETLCLKIEAMMTKNAGLEHGRFIISSLFFVTFICVLVSINTIRFDTVLKFSKFSFSSFGCQSNNNNSSLNNKTLSGLTNTISENDEIRVLMGVLTLPDQYHRRHFLRMIYGTQKPARAKIDLKFVFCNLTKEDQKTLVALEIMRYDDIIILNCPENMDNGKTYTYFSSLSEMLLNNSDYPRYPPYHYVMKTDDDTFFRLDALVNSLRPLSREDLYWGSVIPCESTDPFGRYMDRYPYMSGMGYMVSWDIVEWVKDSEIPKQLLEGPEDRNFAEWLRQGHKGKNRFSANWTMYDYPQPRTGCTHELWPDTIGVHRLKNQEKWINTLEYFNFTHNLKPSKLYHIP